MQFLVLSLGTVVCKLLSLRNTEYSFHEPVPALLQFRVNRLSAFQYSWCAYQKWMTRLSLSVNLHTDENLYPFGFSAGDSRLFRTDDGSSSAIFLFSRFRFFGTSEFTLYVSWLHLHFHKSGTSNYLQATRPHVCNTTTRSILGGFLFTSTKVALAHGLHPSNIWYLPYLFE